MHLLTLRSSAFLLTKATVTRKINAVNRRQKNRPSVVSTLILLQRLIHLLILRLLLQPAEAYSRK